MYKLTDEKGQTLDKAQWVQGTQWGPGVTHHVTFPLAPNPRLRSPELIHAYTDPNLALLLNPIHCGFRFPRLWAARGVVVRSSWDEVGCYTLTTTRELALPDWYLNRRREVVVEFARLCAAAAAAAGPGPAAGFASDAAGFAACAMSAPDAVHAAMAAGFAVLAIYRAAAAAGRTIDFMALAGEARGEGFNAA